MPNTPPGSGSPAPRSRWRAFAVLALAAAGAATFFLIRPATVTDDTYAFLDWGRDLRHGYLPLLEHRTFHPVPILTGAFLSLFGSSATTITVLASLVSLMLLAIAAWRVLVLLGFPQPAPLLAAVLVLSSPMLSVIALSAYINVPFATLLLWGLVMELEDRPSRAWPLLMIAGLVRPEGWAFLLAYGLLRWLREGRSRAPRRLLVLAALALAPMVLWILLEWALFGDPLYSFSSTRAPNVKNTHTNTVVGIWRSLQFSVAILPLIAAAIGLAAVARLSPRRLGLTVLAMTGVAGFTIVVLASSKFNVPSRHYSAVVALVCILAAAGATAPARLIERHAGARTRVAALVGVLCAAVVLGVSAPRLDRLLRRDARNIGTSYDYSRSLDAALAQARRVVDVSEARRHSVAIVGAVVVSEVVWTLNVPFNAVTGDIEASTRMVVEPSPAAYLRLRKQGLTEQQRLLPPAGWHKVVETEDWDVWVIDSPGPARLG